MCLFNSRIRADNGRSDCLRDSGKTAHATQNRCTIPRFFPNRFLSSADSGRVWLIQTWFALRSDKYYRVFQRASSIEGSTDLSDSRLGLVSASLARFWLDGFAPVFRKHSKESSRGG